MNSLYQFFTVELVEALGWTIVHSLWQGIVVTLSLSLLLLFLRKNSAQLRYIISFFALIILLGWSGITFVNTYRYAKEKAVLRDNLTSNPNYIKTFLAENYSEETAKEVIKAGPVNLQMIKLRSFLQRNFALICTFWIIGMLFLMLRMIGGFVYAYRLRTYQLIDIGEEWLRKIEAFSEKLHIKRKVQAFFSPLAAGPITLGMLKPVLLFPVTAFTGLSVKDIEAIIAHELAHVLRHDYLFNIIQSVCEILFFYHPGVWIISSQIRNERENSCDNIAIGLTGDKIAYVKALAAVQIQQMEQGQLAMAFASSKGNILQRIKRLQTKVAMKTNFIEGLIAAAVVVAGLTLASFTPGNENEVIPFSKTPASQSVSSDETTPLPVPVIRSARDMDSIRTTLEENILQKKKVGPVSEEVGKMVEIALSERDRGLSAGMMESINRMLNGLDINGILASALNEASLALEEADMATMAGEAGDSIDQEEFQREMKKARCEIEEARKEIQRAHREAVEEIDYEEIRRDLAEARRDIEEARKEIKEARREMEWEMRHNMENEYIPEGIIELSIGAAQIGLDAASFILENLNIEAIVAGALRGAAESLNNIEEMTYDSVRECHELTEKDIEQLKEELKQKEEKIKQEKEALKQKEKELKNKGKEKFRDSY